MAVYETKQAITILKLAVSAPVYLLVYGPPMSQVVSVVIREKTLEEISMPADSVEGEKTNQDLTKEAESSASA